MALLSVTYELHDTFASALEAAGGFGEHGNLAASAPMRPGPLSTPKLTSLPSVIAHCMAGLGVVLFQSGLKRIRVLDVGGGLAGHFGYARASFGPSAQLDWTVLEKPNFVDYANTYVRDRDVRFVADIAKAPRKIDLAYFSGVVQYVEDLSSLLSAEGVRGAEWVFIARSSFADVPQPYLQVVTYSDRVARLPGIVHSRAALNAQMEQLGYRLYTSWEDEHHVAGQVRPAPSMLWRRAP